jgi:FixJ family two-component response regulator
MKSPPVIHVVNDDAAFRAAVARLLRASVYQVVLRESGDQLLKNLPHSEPARILLDICWRA